jgi:hypothetical protein
MRKQDSEKHVPYDFKFINKSEKSVYICDCMHTYSYTMRTYIENTVLSWLSNMVVKRERDGGGKQREKDSLKARYCHVLDGA